MEKNGVNDWKEMMMIKIQYKVIIVSKCFYKHLGYWEWV